MKIKTSKLAGPALAWAMAALEGTPCRVWGLGSCRFNGVSIRNNKSGTCTAFVLRDAHFEKVYAACDEWPLARDQKIWQPHTDWSQGGPIVEREGLRWNKHGDQFYVWTPDHPWYDPLHEPMWAEKEGVNWRGFAYGPTLLIAAMRCYVASKLGDEIDVPDDLLQERTGA